MPVRTFRLWASSALAQVGSRVEPAWHALRRDWGISFAVGSAEPAHVSELPSADRSAHWQACLRLGHGTLWLGWNGGMERAVSTVLYPLAHEESASGYGTIAAAAGAACLAGLTTALAEALGAAVESAVPVTPPATLWRPGSGALVIKGMLRTAQLHILLDADAVAAIAPCTNVPPLARPASIALDTLLGDASMTLRVTTGMVNLSLGDVTSLAPGDVIAFDTPLEQPLLVTTPTGQPVCGARMLRNADRCVFEMTGQRATTI